MEEQSKVDLQKCYMNSDSPSERGCIWALLQGSARDWSRVASWTPVQMLPNKKRQEKAIYAEW